MKTPGSRMIALILVTCGVFMTLSVAALAQTAGYRVTFATTWTEVTHPTDYPPDPHFSGLVGGTHDGTVSFWEVGQLASTGMKQMAEWGSQGALLSEVEEAIDAGQAEFTVSDLPLWDVPGSTSIDFTISPDFPLVTLVAMIAPSPDWFIGVRGLDLRPGGQWATEITVDLFAFDAGTDSGPSYTSPDQATVPPEPIAAIDGYPFTVGVPLGTLTFTRLYVSDVPVAGALRAVAYPNPFNPRTTIAWELPTAGPLRVDIHDAAGRLVRTLVAGPAAAGEGRAVWNGRDATGRPAASGVYFARVVHGTETVTRKLTLLE